MTAACLLGSWAVERLAAWSCALDCKVVVVEVVVVVVVVRGPEWAAGRL